MSTSRLPGSQPVLTHVAAALLALAMLGTATAQRMQFPTQVPLEAAPAFNPEGLPGPAPGAPGAVQPPPGWDPYGTPAVGPAPLFPQDPTMPGLPQFSPAQARRFLQAIRLDYHWLVGQGAGELGVNEIEASATFAFPFFYSLQTPLLVTPGFAVTLFNGPETPGRPDLSLPPSVYDAYLDTAWRPQITPWFGADLNFRIGVYTDFNTIRQDSVRLSGAGYGTLTFSPAFQIKAGVIYLDRVKVKILPAGGVIWTPNPDVRFDVLFPNPRFAARLSTIGNTDWWVYLRGEYGGGSWTVTHANSQIERIDYNDIRVAMGLEFRGLRGTTGYFEVGGSFSREIVYQNHPSSDTIQPNPTVFLGAGLVY